MTMALIGKRVTGAQKDSALREMIDHSLAEASPAFREAVFAECLRREEVATTVVEKGLAFPHAKITEAMAPTVCVGYSDEGIVWDSSGQVVHIIVLLICQAEDHLATLADVASTIQSPGVHEKLMSATTPEAIIEILQSAKKRRSRQTPSDKSRLTRAMVEHVSTQVTALESSRLFLFTNTPASLAKVVPALQATPLSLVTNKKDLGPKIALYGSSIDKIYQVGANLSDEKAILLELWANDQLKEDEVIVCLSGLEFNDTPCSMSIHAIPRDLTNESRILSYQVPAAINLEILNRVILLAMELAREGREGKPVGALFVLGDTDEIRRFCKQLIVNPFSGLDDQNRSILDPSLSETIKEYAKIDGAFIIDNEGVIQSAGTYLSIPPNQAELASGLGARHAAALGITLVGPVVSVAISESTQTIRVYWDGAEQDLYVS